MAFSGVVRTVASRYELSQAECRRAQDGGARPIQVFVPSASPLGHFVPRHRAHYDDLRCIAHFIDGRS